MITNIRGTFHVVRNCSLDFVEWLSGGSCGWRGSEDFGESRREKMRGGGRVGAETHGDLWKAVDGYKEEEPLVVEVICLRE